MEKVHRTPGSPHGYLAIHINASSSRFGVELARLLMKLMLTFPQPSRASPKCHSHPSVEFLEVLLRRLPAILYKR